METKPYLFRLGGIVATPGALTALTMAGEVAIAYLHRHHTGDFGDLEALEHLRNYAAIMNGTTIRSTYRLQNGTKIWIITEADRSRTTLLLPAEYC